ncbi:MAG: ATP-binding cassette domain-containing protein [Defluviitoga tunisiensis]
MHKASVIQFVDYSMEISNKTLLKNINLEFAENETFLVYGPRNSGKSLLLRSIVDLNNELFRNVKSSGAILFQGENIVNLEGQYLRSQISYCEPTFVDNINFLTLSEVLYLALGLKVSDITKDQFLLLEKLNLSHIFADRNTLKSYEHFDEWTIGDKISFIIFLNIARNPQVFIFDSILDHLDDFLLNNIKEFLYETKKDKTLIISTRNIKLFSDIAQRIGFIANGEILFTGDIQDFMLSFPV